MKATVAAVSLALSQASVAGLLNIAGPRHFQISGGGGATETPVWQEWDALSATYIVDPEKTTDGDGTEGDPWQMEQIRTCPAPTTSHIIIEILPGRFTIDSNNASGNKYAFIYPNNDGASASARIIIRARYRGEDVIEANRTYVGRSNPGMAPEWDNSSRGSLIGGLNNNWIVWQGIWLDTDTFPDYTDDMGGFGEYASISHWGCNNCGVFQCHATNGNGVDYLGGNQAIVYEEGCTLMTYTDNYLANIGAGTDAGAGNVGIFQSYDCNRTTFAYNTVSGPAAYGVYFKGTHDAEKDQVYGHRVHNNLIDGTSAGIIFASPKYGTSPLDPNGSWAFKNVIIDAQIPMYARSFNSNEPNGIAFCNNTIYRTAVYAASGWFGFSTAYFAFLGGSSAWAEESLGDRILIHQNNSYSGGAQYAIHANPQRTEVDNWISTKNAYHGYTVAFGKEGDGGASFTLANWQGEYDTSGNVVTDDPSLADPANGDVEIDNTSPCWLAGLDVLNIDGNGLNEPINMGAWTARYNVFGLRAAA